MLRAAFCEHSIEQIEVLVEVKDCSRAISVWCYLCDMPRTVHGNPFHNVRVLGLHHDSLEVAFHEGSVDERTAQEERLLRGGVLRVTGRW